MALDQQIRLMSIYCPECGADVMQAYVAVKTHVRHKHRELSVDERHQLERRILPNLGKGIDRNLLRLRNRS